MSVWLDCQVRVSLAVAELVSSYSAIHYLFITCDKQTLNFDQDAIQLNAILSHHVRSVAQLLLSASHYCSCFL